MLEIAKIEIFITGDPNQDKPRWSYYLTDIYTTNTICRITTKDGYVGIGGTITYSESHFDTSMGETMRIYLPLIMGMSCLDSEKIWNFMAKRPTLIAKPAMSAIDIAIWDIRAKYAKMPLYQMLGGNRSKILSYASTPLLKNDDQYLEYIEKAIKVGFKAIKIHPYGIFKEDFRLVDAVQAKFKDKVTFMLDPDQQYNREESYIMTKKCEDYGYAWMESPLPDTDLEGYRDLKKKTNIAISNGGNHYLDLQDIRHGIDKKAWTDIRIDATVCGGITPIRKIVALGEANNMRTEIQSWGMTLTQAANLHMMLATSSCTYFEQAYPYEPFEIGAKTVIRTDKDGYVHAPSGHNGYGLGIELDWDEIEKITLAKYEVV